MATTQKEYNMLFKLSASLAGSYTKSFGTAKNEITKLEAVIKSLNQKQADIASYQKQQTAVDNTTRKLKDLKEQYANLQEAYDKTGKADVLLKNKMIDKQRLIEKTEKSLETQKQKLKELEGALKEAGIDTSKLTELMADLRKQVKATSEQVEDAKSRMENGITAIGEAFEAAGIVDVLNDIADGYKECVKASMEFEATMSKVEALSGSNADQLDNLSEKAKELGLNTVFTATESAQAFSYMALAGWSNEEMIEGIDAVLNLAAASGIDLATASDYITTNLKALGLQASDTNRLVDIMAYAMANSATTTGELAEAYKTVAPTAKAFGVSTEELTAILMTMANAGIRGSEAGNGLNMILTRLATDTSNAAQELAEYGVEIFDSSGNLRNFTDILNEMADAFHGLNMEESAELAKRISGARQYNKLTVMLSGFSSAAIDAGRGYNNFLEQLQNESSGSATQMAATMLDNLKGKMQLFDDATDALKMTLGEEFADEIGKLIDLARNGLTALNWWIEKTPALTKGVLTFVGALGAMIAVIKTATVVIPLLSSALTLLEAHPIMLAIAGVAALTVGTVTLVKKLTEEDKMVRSLTISSQKEYKALKQKEAEYKNAVKVYGETHETTKRLKAEVDELTQSYETNKQTQEELLASYESANEGINSTTDEIRNSLNSVDEYNGHITDLIGRLQTLSNTEGYSAETYGEIEAIVNTLNEELPELAINYEDVINGNADIGGLLDKWVQQEAKARKYQAAVDNITDAYSNVQDAEKNAADVYAKRAEAYTAFLEAEQAYLYPKGYEYGVQSGPAEYDAYTQTKEKFDELTNAVTEANTVLRDARDVYEECKKELGDYYIEINGNTEAEYKMNAAVSKTITDLTTLTEKYTTAYEAAYKSITGQYDLWDTAATVTATSVSSLTSSIQSQTDYWTNYDNNLQKLISASTIEGLGGLSDIINELSDGSAESVNAVAGIVQALDSGDITGVQNLVVAFTDLTNAQKGASDSLADMASNYTNEYKKIQTEFTNTISELDLTQEMIDKGQAAIESFVNGANNELGTVKDKFTELGNSAASAFQAALNNHKYNISVTANVDVSEGVSAAYASGTDYARQGIALVGENGPELVYMRGGEKVLTANQTSKVLGGNSITVSPNITINGVDSDTARSTADNILELVYNALDTINTDRMRRAYT